MRTNPMADQISHHAVAKALRIFLDCRGNVIKMIAGFCKLNPFVKTLLCHLNELFCRFADLADPVGPGRIGVIALINHAHIKAHDIPVPQDTLFAWNTVHHLVVYRDADRSRIAVIIFKRGLTAIAADNFLSQMIDLPGRHPGPKLFSQLLMRFGENLSRLPHQLNLSGRFN